MSRLNRGKSVAFIPAGLSPGRRATLIAATLLAACVMCRDEPAETFAAPYVVSVPSVTPVAFGPDATPFFTARWITPKGHTVSAHSSTICVLPDGGLFAAWYGGSREGGADVALFGSRFGAGAQDWIYPEKLVDREIAERELDRTIKKVGNAVVFADAAGTLWMIYVSVSVGGWSGSALNVRTSRDGGTTWTQSRRLTANPFLNISSLVRNKPIHASDGRIGVPIYHEFALNYPQMLWITPGRNGDVADYHIRNLVAESGLIQPTLVPLGGDRVLMLLRDRSATRRMRTAYSEDSGWTWSDTGMSDLPNPDSALDALRLRDGRILVAYNHAERGRENLRLAVSMDKGRTWQPGPVLEAADRREYSYPQLAQDWQGHIHVSYSWQRERIRHVEFNVAWLDHQIVGGLPVAMAQ